LQDCFRCCRLAFYKAGKYNIDGAEFTDAGLLEFYEGLIKSFPIISIEDPFAEEDWKRV